MPIIRVNHPAGTLSADQKSVLASRIGRSIMSVEMGDDNVTKTAEDIVLVQYSETPHSAWLIGGISRQDVELTDAYVVEIIVAAGFFTAALRAEVHRRVGNDFTEVLHDPALDGRVVTVINEGVRNGWGVSGKPVSATDIATMAGVPADSARFAELMANDELLASQIR
jgi:phenylpyruvate tautomerase PptA (4-oxalocrotonate tautomerase family)